jgi:hypothetical protein
VFSSARVRPSASTAVFSCSRVQPSINRARVNVPAFLADWLHANQGRFGRREKCHVRGSGSFFFFGGGGGGGGGGGKGGGGGGGGGGGEG